MLAASTATGQLVFLPLIAELADPLRLARGADLRVRRWPASRLIASLLMPDRPSDLGLPPYGEAGHAAAADGAGLVSLAMAPLTVLERSGARADFWVLFGTFFVCGAAPTA